MEEKPTNDRSFKLLGKERSSLRPQREKATDTTASQMKRWGVLSERGHREETD